MTGSAIDIEILKADYCEYTKESKQRWKLANCILYKMCEDNPLHEDDDIISSKVLLIGRAYAAAVERQHKGIPTGDKYYYEKVAPKIKGLNIDESIAEINSGVSIKDSKNLIIKLHSVLSGFGGDDEKARTSFASKYLHFHCPDKFFIYDERVKKVISRYVKRIECEFVDTCKNKDYQIFFNKALAIQDLIIEMNYSCSPRKLDDFLLWVFENKVDTQN